MVDGCRIKLVNVMSGVSQGSVLGPLLFRPYTSGLISIFDNKLIGYAVDSTIIIIIKRGWQCKAGREWLPPYQSEDPNPTTPTHRKKEEKGKTVGDKKGASS